MQPTAMLLPVFVQIGLTFFLLFWMARERVGALNRGEVKTAEIALGQQAWPKRPTQIANAFRNQLELPVLFYVLVAFVLITGHADFVLLLLAWAFVLSRIVHARIHTTNNIVRHRFAAYAVGVFALGAMWVYFGASLIAASLV